LSALAFKLRVPVIAVVVLLFSAGLALAGGGLVFPELGSSPTADDGDDTGDHGDLVSQAAQMDTPDGFRNHGAFVSCVARELYEDDSDGDAEEVVLAELTPEDCERDDSEDEAETDDPEDETDEDGWKNHGAMVSEAAQMETPDGFEHRGAFVSCVAKMSYGKKGSEAPADFALADLTPEDCDRAADETASDSEDEDEAADEDKGKDKADKDKGKGKGNGQGKGHGRGR
jgi:hypothetical protein